MASPVLTFAVQAFDASAGHLALISPQYLNIYEPSQESANPPFITLGRENISHPDLEVRHLTLYLAPAGQPGCLGLFALFFDGYDLYYEPRFRGFVGSRSAAPGEATQLRAGDVIWLSPSIYVTADRIDAGQRQPFQPLQSSSQQLPLQEQQRQHDHCGLDARATVDSCCNGSTSVREDPVLWEKYGKHVTRGIDNIIRKHNDEKSEYKHDRTRYKGCSPYAHPPRWMSENGDKERKPSFEPTFIMERVRAARKPGPMINPDSRWGGWPIGTYGKWLQEVLAAKRYRKGRRVLLPEDAPGVARAHCSAVGCPISHHENEAQEEGEQEENEEEVELEVEVEEEEEERTEEEVHEEVHDVQKSCDSLAISTNSAGTGLNREESELEQEEQRQQQQQPKQTQQVQQVPQPQQVQGTHTQQEQHELENANKRRRQEQRMYLEEADSAEQTGTDYAVRKPPQKKRRSAAAMDKFVDEASDIVARMDARNRRVGHERELTRTSIQYIRTSVMSASQPPFAPAAVPVRASAPTLAPTLTSAEPSGVKRGRPRGRPRGSRSKPPAERAIARTASVAGSAPAGAGKHENKLDRGATAARGGLKQGRGGHLMTAGQMHATPTASALVTPTALAPAEDPSGPQANAGQDSNAATLPAPTVVLRPVPRPAWPAADLNIGCGPQTTKIIPPPIAPVMPALKSANSSASIGDNAGANSSASILDNAGANIGDNASASTRVSPSIGASVIASTSPPLPVRVKEAVQSRQDLTAHRPYRDHLRSEFVYITFGDVGVGPKRKIRPLATMRRISLIFALKERLGDNATAQLLQAIVPRILPALRLSPIKDPSPCFEMVVRKSPEALPRSIAEFASMIRADDDYASVVDTLGRATTNNDAALVKRMCSFGEKWYWSFCTNTLLEFELNRHCRKCEECVGWSAWHCKTCNACQYGLTFPCDSCDRELFEERKTFGNDFTFDEVTSSEVIPGEVTSSTPSQKD